MRTHRVVIPPPRVHLRITFTVASIVAVVLTLLAPPASAQWVGCRGSWGSSQTDANWSISWPGDVAEGKDIDGTYTVGKSRRILKGKTTGNSIKGDWTEEEKDGRRGTFVFSQFSSGRRMQITFYYQGNQIESSEWFCGPAPTPTQPLGETKETIPSPTQKPTPTPTPTPVPLPPRSFKGDGDHDTDNFQTFDALPKATQEQMLVKRGPRLPKQYNSNDLSMRVFVKGGWPIVLDYGLAADAIAHLQISVSDEKPFVTRLDPAKRARVTITLPDHFGAQPQVGKLRITAFTKMKEPADFQLYGLGMGEAGAQALNRLIEIGPSAQLAVSSFAFGPAANDEGLALFAPAALQDLLPITVSPPRTIKSPKKKPKKYI